VLPVKGLTVETQRLALCSLSQWRCLTLRQYRDATGEIPQRLLVRFTPNSDRERETPQTVMSALPPKADMCAAVAMSAWPIADIPARPSKKII